MREAESLERQGKYDAALLKLEVLKTKYPHFPGLFYVFGRCYAALGDYFHAIQSFIRALDRESTDFASLFLLSIVFFNFFLF